MKKFILRIALFMLPVLVAFVGLEVTIRLLPHDLSLKKDYLDKHAHEIETLILGSSHSYYGVDPKYFSSNTFNAAYVSQSLLYDYLILKKYKNELIHLKDIVIPISYFSLWSMLGQGRESWRVGDYNIYYNIIDKRAPYTAYFAVLNKRLINQLAYLLAVHSGAAITCSNKGWGNSYHSTNVQDLDKTGQIAAQRHTRDISVDKEKRAFEENVNNLDSILSWANKHHVHVTLFTPPAYRSYYKLLSVNQLQKTIQTAKSFVSKYKNVSYVNLLTDTSFIARDFYDGDHLSEIGAKKLSLMIDSIVESREY